MRVSAIFESTDHAEIAARRVSEAGVVITKRQITDLTDQSFTEPRLPTDEFYFPAAAEFYTGMVQPTNVVMPGVAFYPMGGHIDNHMPYSGEAKLELEIDEQESGRVREMLLGMHGTGIHSYQ